ncbi:MAG: DUF748 domain-containing protein [Cyclobacteriaceae bacterium]
MTIKRKTILAILFIFVGAAGFLLLRTYVFKQIGDSLQEKLQSLKVSGFNVEYDSISIDWRRNTITIDHLVLQKNAYDTTCVYPEFISVEKITAQGFGLFPLLFKRKLSFENVYLESPHLVIRDHSRLMVDSATQRANEFTLAIEKVFVKSGRVEYTDTLNCELLTGLRSDLMLGGLQMDFHVKKPFVFNVDLVSLDSTEVRLPKEFYTLNFKRTRADLLRGTLQVDSLVVKPDFGKIEFGRKRGYEIDRFEGIIPFIKLSGFSILTRDSIAVRSTLADVQFYLKIFRDKRLPFKTQVKELPIAQLKGLPFALKIDSLKITKSFVQYEELVKDGIEAGTIYFDDLSAILKNINNRSNEGSTSLVANASLMGQGNARITATFPLAKNKNAWIAGAIENFSIPKLNPMLTPSTNIKVESGNMNKLSFSFSFNNLRSDGEIELNYNDLKLVSFKGEEKRNGQTKKGKEDDLQKDNLKTFIMNTFIFRKNMDEKVPEDKRTGTVMYFRDDSRSMFNYWIKSILAGVKSAYHLEKPEANKNNRDSKKEEKQSKKQARKQRKAEKRRERG